MTLDHPLYRFEQLIGYRFRNAAYLEQALTHSSRGTVNNERIEFLGDRVLNLIMAHALFEQFPQENEGSLAKRHAALVQGRLLAAVGVSVDLHEFVMLSDSERQSGGADNENIIADAMEAVLGAMYLDGGLDAARPVVTRLWDKYILSHAEVPQDAKTELQERVQAKGLKLPEYEIVGRSGPDHAPNFDVEVRVDGMAAHRASGPSRRHAEKEAARLMLAAMDRQ